ncbi:MAG TPA: YihY/virulence factor BrkB family protein [Gaiellaceae bacterium]|jgi:membrane protein
MRRSAPQAEPERQEQRLSDPRLRDLSFTDWKAIVTRAFKAFLQHNGTLLASALAYSTFFAIPSVLLVATGLFTLIASPQTITDVIDHFQGVVPQQALTLLKGSLHRADANQGGTIAATIIGFVLAVWAVTGAMNSYMTALDLAYGRQKDRRSFVRRRVKALQLAAVLGLAFALVAILLMFGPVVESSISRHVGGAGSFVSIAWWVAQWPILLGGLLLAFAAVLYLGPDVEHAKFELVTPGSLVAALLWIAVSALFAVYTATFASYNRAWGALSAVIVMLTWLWLTAVALLLGAEINAEVERSRQLQRT